jgi:hypothetical protein
VIRKQFELSKVKNIIEVGVEEYNNILVVYMKNRDTRYVMVYLPPIKGGLRGVLLDAGCGSNHG